ncbi:MAG TPA: hypothetical protein DHU63_06320 [Candidatus Marinimicrobia bacterium]|nr:MAG: hypothetical protein AUJ47_08630 [Candidatus Marinimicrobia bacterium CG1_02_48_14]PIZ66448.1 MAG: hypothetical protein COY19_06755 [Candidatus Marinimicrobia bacterium CG_4_10_14_0_2_um_filter_48_9]PJA51859.1 MAG: hypothetical protein CO167_11730 [Candidatus Marinimicrobia bacterium CG_4_9_14_3_um_filter_48_9]HCW76137.1 hypothetical protein [Candidatus Neomarinimicrobiota bacterium]
MAVSDFNLTQRFTLFTPKEQKVYPIPERDLKKIGGMLQHISIKNYGFQVMASLVFGMIVGLILFVLGYQSVVNTGFGISPALLTIVIVSFGVGIGIALIILARQQAKQVADARESVLNELDLIEDGFAKPVLEKSYESQKSDSVS